MGRILRFGFIQAKNACTARKKLRWGTVLQYLTYGTPVYEFQSTNSNLPYTSLYTYDDLLAARTAAAAYDASVYDYIICRWDSPAYNIYELDGSKPKYCVFSYK